MRNVSTINATIKLMLKKPLKSQKLHLFHPHPPHPSPPPLRRLSSLWVFVASWSSAVAEPDSSLWNSSDASGRHCRCCWMHPTLPLIRYLRQQTPPPSCKPRSENHGCWRLKRKWPCWENVSVLLFSLYLSLRQNSSSLSSSSTVLSLSRSFSRRRFFLRWPAEGLGGRPFSLPSSDWRMVEMSFPLWPVMFAMSFPRPAPVVINMQPSHISHRLCKDATLPLPPDNELSVAITLRKKSKQ